nr:hypothetical protein [Sorangium cellulosum]
MLPVERVERAHERRRDAQRRLRLEPPAPRDQIGEARRAEVLEHERETAAMREEVERPRHARHREIAQDRVFSPEPGELAEGRVIALGDLDGDGRAVSSTATSIQSRFDPLMDEHVQRDP